MKYLLHTLLACCMLVPGFVRAQDAPAYQWQVSAKKTAEGVYELTFTTPGNAQWQLYGPNESFDGVPAVELQLGDSSISVSRPFTESGNGNTINSAIFENSTFKVYEGPLSFTATVEIKGKIPAQLLGSLTYTYGKGDEFYPGNAWQFAVPLEGGVAAGKRVKLDAVDLNNPVIAVGGTGTEGANSMWGIFILGLLGGFLALIMPCTFPMIPLTVSFFTKQTQNKRKGVFNAFMYGFFIFLIYVLLSLPFYFLDSSSSNILNEISTNAWLNLFFAAVFFVFALSFFGLFEITLPSSVSNKVGAKGNIGSLGGIFFMALTLAIVSFSCTGPILGSLLVGSLKEGGVIQLTIAMAGFGLALGLPFGLFAMFPGWLASLPKSGSWMDSVKKVFAFVELALFIKFLSNADLVMHWGILPREVFFGIWIVLGLATSLYLFGAFRFPGEAPVKKLGKIRIVFATLFLLFTLYLVPGITNTKYANLALVSGFPPPLSYSIYGHGSAKGKGVEAHVTNDYEKAIQLAREQNKPLLIDFTGWACVNCRKMEENVWTQPQIKELIEQNFILVSLYVDDRKALPKSEQFIYTASDSSKKTITTIGDLYATMQSENFKNASQPLYVILNGDEKLMNLPVGYTPNESEYAKWLSTGLEAFNKGKKDVVAE